MDMNRLSDMLERYGEVCSQKQAARLLNVVPRTISRMMDEGRLRRVARGVDVRSICEYIENPKKANFTARATATARKSTLQAGTFLAASRTGRWAPKQREER